MEPNLDDGSLTAARFYGFIFFFLKKPPTTKLCLLFKLMAPNRKRPKFARWLAFIRVEAGYQNRGLQNSANSENP
jgi:hypothetical protein